MHKSSKFDASLKIKVTCESKLNDSPWLSDVIYKTSTQFVLYILNSELTWKDDQI